MKQNRLLNGILASSLVLSMAVPALAVSVEDVPVLQEQSTQTLATSESDFSFSNGTITKYNGKDAIVVIPSTINGQTVTKIGDNAFNDNDYMLNVTIPDTVTEIGKYAFYSCSNVMTWYIPASISVMGLKAFYYCSKSADVYYGGSEITKNNIICYEVGGSFFETAHWHYNSNNVGTGNAPTTKLNTINNYPTTSESDFTFANGVITKYKGSDTVVIIPSTINGQVVTKIGDNAFNDNDTMMAVKIPNSVSEIGKYAFYSCSSLLEASIPASISVIGLKGFYYCSNTKNVYYGGSESTKSNIIAYEVGGSLYETAHWHYNTTSAGTANPPSTKLNTILATPETTAADFSFSNGTISKYSGSATVVVIPSYINGQKVTKIGENAFNDNDNMVALYIPNTVTEVASYGFYSCSSLTDAAFPSSVSVIGLKGFYYCSNTQNVYYSGSENTKNNIIQTEVGGSFFENSHWHYNSDLTQTTAQAPVVTPSVTPTTPSVTPTTPTTPTVTPGTNTDPSKPANGSTDVTVYGDVTVNNWYYNYVEVVVNQNIMVGYGDSFMPELNATRGTISQSLANMSRETIPYTSSTNFADVSGTGFESYVAWCEEKGLMSGIGDGQFGVNNNVTREQFALILKQFANYQNNDTTVSVNAVNSLSAFSDSGSISSWALEGIAWAVENGLMSGSDGLLNPTGNISRAQVATMLYTYGMTLG